MIGSLFWVFLGGGLGSICRYSIALLIPISTDFPWATWIANFISCFILGVLLSLDLKNGISAPYRLLFMTGFCGGFSTFSTFTGEYFLLFLDGQITMGFLYILVSLIFCLIAMFLGLKIIELF